MQHRKLLNGPFVTGPSVRQYTENVLPRMKTLSRLKVKFLSKDVSSVIIQFVLENEK